MKRTKLSLEIQVIELPTILRDKDGTEVILHIGPNKIYTMCLVFSIHSILNTKNYGSHFLCYYMIYCKMVSIFTNSDN